MDVFYLSLFVVMGIDHHISSLLRPVLLGKTKTTSGNAYGAFACGRRAFAQDQMCLCLGGGAYAFDVVLRLTGVNRSKSRLYVTLGPFPLHVSLQEVVETVEVTQMIVHVSVEPILSQIRPKNQCPTAQSMPWWKEY